MDWVRKGWLCFTSRYCVLHEFNTDRDLKDKTLLLSTIIIKNFSIEWTQDTTGVLLGYFIKNIEK